MERNLTPNSTALASESVTNAGVAALFHMLHGQVTVPEPTVTLTPAEGDSRLPLSSTARLFRVTVAPAPGVVQA